MANSEHTKNHYDVSLQSSQGFSLEYVSGSGDTMARDYFDTYDEAKEMYEDLIKAYEHDGPTAMALNLTNEETGELIDAWEW